MTEFEWGLAIGSILGIVFGICLAVVMIKVEARRDKRPGYITLEPWEINMLAQMFDERNRA